MNQLEIALLERIAVLEAENNQLRARLKLQEQEFTAKPITAVMKVETKQRIIPPELHNIILQLHRAGFGNVAIRDKLHISGENYWMIKSVVETYQQQQAGETI